MQNGLVESRLSLQPCPPCPGRACLMPRSPAKLHKPAPVPGSKRGLDVVSSKCKAAATAIVGSVPASPADGKELHKLLQLLPLPLQKVLGSQPQLSEVCLSPPGATLCVYKMQCDLMACRVENICGCMHRCSKPPSHNVAMRRACQRMPKTSWDIGR